jgi:cobalt-zinc-cadmium efflux system outer membrane protein
VRATPRAALALLALALGGCASVPVREVFSDAAELAQERSGQRVEWPEVTADFAQVDEAIRETLARPLDAEAAAQVALLNNRRLHARYAELGRAAAAKVQAGLPPNPFLELVARFQDGDGGTPQLEISVAEEFLDLFLLPARKRLAAVELERAKLDVAGAVVDLTAVTRGAFVSYQAERQLLELDRQALLAVEAAWEMARQMREAGNVSELDLLLERDFYEQVRMEVALRELRVAGLRERINELLGLWGERATSWSSEARLPDLPDAVSQVPEDPEREAVGRSLDVAGAVLDLEAAARRLGVADVTSVFPELEAGIDAEREVEHAADGTEHAEWWYGPRVAFRLPVFDQGQPRRVGARMEIRGRWDELTALGVEVRSAARRWATEVEYAERRARYLRDVVLPLRVAVTRQTQLHYNGMFLGVFQLLDAKRREVEAGREYVTALRDYWLARGALEQVLAGRLPAPGSTGRAGGGEPGSVRGEGAGRAHR